MAERKYDLALVETLNQKPIKRQEWYKERLHTKYIKQLKPGERINSHHTKNWVFMKDGLDDFRDGLPPVVQGSDFIKTQKGTGPAIHYEMGKDNQVKQPAARKRLSKFQVYISKSTPQQQQRRDYITEVEQGLLKHPLALYPHLEDSVMPELFEDIVDLLDPQFNIQDLQEDLDEQTDPYTLEGARPGYGTMDSVTKNSHKDADKGLKDLEDMVSNIKRNPYRWLPRKDKDKKEGKKMKEKDKAWPTSPSEEEHIKKVTQEFCDWVADLGGESNNIEESTITSLFASGYETKPALSVPIHVVELTNVPQELRLSAAVPPPAPVVTKPAVADEESTKQQISGDYQPSWVKFKYGAWYLNPRTWKKMDYNEPLTDPKQLKEHEMSEAKKKSNELNHELSNMHASKAFADFISKKNTRRPEFLVEVAEIQKKQAEEEQRRLASEALVKSKKGANAVKADAQVPSA
ncbi:protein fam47e-like [Plakobranchus ocellatus]|uniref:Protein fam47e-like n=1 Tax=Plakobranchus ocellatus TaxID=259542 RepID=A0AAV3YI08_9GAST|nr:protein fam47e-like [Plakobranchus ocellatus]